MKLFSVLALGFLALLPTIAGTAVSANNAASVSASNTAEYDLTALTVMKSQAASSDSTLSRPL